MDGWKRTLWGKDVTSISWPWLMTRKTELVVRGVYGAGKTQGIALLAAFFALRGHHVCYRGGPIEPGFAQVSSPKGKTA